MANDGDKDKKQVLLRLSPALWRELASWSADEFRSINGQIEYLLTECVRQRRGTTAKHQEERDD
ncbi:MAG: Arc family DNA-binding protein [Spirochaetales bacterium]|nr:Arc family DNA-binding protein [Spirochaetales bacterium]